MLSKRDIQHANAYTSLMHGRGAVPSGMRGVRGVVL